MQKSSEKAIIQINKFIIEMNLTNKMITPFIADTVMTKTDQEIRSFTRNYQMAYMPEMN